MITELFGRKIINFATPYKRSFITLEPVGSEIPRTLTMPSVKSAVFFLNNGDALILDNIEELEKLCYIDYDLVNNKDKNLVKFYDDFHAFKEIVKTQISINGYCAFNIVRKLIYSDVIHIVCNLLTVEHDDSNSRDVLNAATNAAKSAFVPEPNSEDQLQQMYGPIQ